jgi:NAD(P)-dependent dehydrogenase (short-subunit alcohol dehydrogenase family)
MSVEGKAAIVTGGASGMGRAAARILAAKGARVLLTDRDADGVRQASEEIVAAGGQAIAAEVDVGDSRQVAAVVQRALDAFGRIDILVHAAGICPRKPLLEITDEEWRQVLRVNLEGSFYVTREVGRAMVAQRAGTMVLLTSDRGVNGSIDYGHYAASKGGQIALMRSLALTLGRHGITVNAVNPGLTDTPMGRAAVVEWDAKMKLDVLGTCSKPDEIAETILFLAGTGGAYMTGQLISTRMRYGA